MIPKIIHYCWFGKNPKTKLADKCINSWKKYCPDYEIVEWNESNFDLNYCSYAKEAYDCKKWAFVTDVVRLYALVNFGGIYMDTDVEVIKPLDEILKYKAVSGFQTPETIPTGLMASEKEHPLFEMLLHDYDSTRFIQEDGSYDMTTNVSRITNICVDNGLCLNNTEQTIKDFTLFPIDYFCAKNIISGKIEKTANTITIHHFAGSWIDKGDKYRGKIARFCYRFLGTETANKLRVFFGRK